MLKEYRPSEIVNLKLHGRTNNTKDPVTLFWSASGIEMNVKACEIRIRYYADFDVFEPWIDVLVNGVRYQRRPLEKGTHEISIWRSTEAANGEEIPVRNIKILRDTPAMAGDASTTVQIEAIYSDGSFEKIEEPKLKLEFIGDSITSGEGCMGPTSEMNWNSACFDVIDHYAFMAARELSADYQLFSQSGWGFCWSWYGNPAENMPAHYDKVCSLVPKGKLEKLGAFEENEAAGFEPDVIIVNLGTNDIGAFSDAAHDNARAMNFDNTHSYTADKKINERDRETLHNGAVSFLSHLREKHPKAKLIWAYGMLLADDSEELTDEMSGLLEGAVSSYAKDSNDDNAFYLRLPLTEEDGFGARFHPGHKSHENTAKCIADFIRSRM